MKLITTAFVAATLATAGMALAAAGALSASEADEPQMQQQTEQREQRQPSAFLQNLVGEWDVVVHAVTDPAQDPYRFEGKETARMLGSQWLVSEFYTEVEGQTIHSILTVGYDTAQQKYVATYVNSMQSQLWMYEGMLDDEGTTLTLKTEGPFMGDPEQKASFRVIIERNEADRWTMGSQIHMAESDQWVEFLSFEYERKDDEVETPQQAR